MSQPTRLNVLQIREPCTESWDAMKGDDRTRFCAGCQLHVHNLSAMPRDEAERLLCESAGRLCVRYAVGADGLPVTLDYQKPGRVRGGWRAWTAVGALGACVAGAVQAFVGGKPIPPQVAAPPPPPPPARAEYLMGTFSERMVMGDVECPAPPPAPAPALQANTAMEVGQRVDDEGVAPDVQ